MIKFTWQDRLIYQLAYYESHKIAIRRVILSENYYEELRAHIPRDRNFPFLNYGCLEIIFTGLDDVVVVEPV